MDLMSLLGVEIPQEEVVTKAATKKADKKSAKKDTGKDSEKRFSSVSIKSIWFLFERDYEGDGKTLKEINAELQSEYPGPYVIAEDKKKLVLYGDNTGTPVKLDKTIPVGSKITIGQYQICTSSEASLKDGFRELPHLLFETVPEAVMSNDLYFPIFKEKKLKDADIVFPVHIGLQNEVVVELSDVKEGETNIAALKRIFMQQYPDMKVSGFTSYTGEDEQVNYLPVLAVLNPSATKKEKLFDLPVDILVDNDIKTLTAEMFGKDQVTRGDVSQMVKKLYWRLNTDGHTVVLGYNEEHNTFIVSCESSSKG